jgi:hypothetical protein
LNDKGLTQKSSSLFWGILIVLMEGNTVWIITLFFKDNTVQFEFETEKEAKEAFRKMNGCKFLTKVV